MTQALAKHTVVAVIGAGAMGAGIAQVAAAAGHSVKLVDTRSGAAGMAVQVIRDQFEKMASKGKLSAQAAQTAAARLQVAEQITDLSDAGLVIEAIVENLVVKQELFQELEAIVSADCILATNTSSISVTAIGAVLKNPQRLAGLHFFNPAPLMALVEVVSGLATSLVVSHILFATAAAWGKTPVHVKSTPGFIVNRVARPYYAEAMRVLAEGGADCATLDACCREAGGFRMGPFELMDMIGHDVNFAVTNSVWRAFFNDQRFLPSLMQQELVDAGFLGRKTGRGFYNYPSDANRQLPTSAPLQPTPDGMVVYGDSPIAQALTNRLKNNQINFSTRAAQDGILATVGDATLRLTDGRTATRCAFETQTPNTVLIDLALDFQKATRLAVSVATQCEATASDSALGLLQAAGFQVSMLRDIPGLIVMRTVAMLANEAADAVNQGVCDAAAVDTAMTLGVNYPRGPLSWADAVGLHHISTVLANLAHTYGEDRYRTSPLIQHHVFAAKAFI